MNLQRTRWLPLLAAAALSVSLVAWSVSELRAANRIRIKAYITGRADDHALLILDDRIEMTDVTRVLAQDAAGDRPLKASEIAPGMLVEAEGEWLDRHKFFAQKITVELRDEEKKIRGSAYLQEEPEEPTEIAQGHAAELKLDGYWLDISGSTKRQWNAEKATATSKEAVANGSLAACQVKYSGVRGQEIGRAHV